MIKVGMLDVYNLLKDTQFKQGFGTDKKVVRLTHST